MKVSKKMKKLLLVLLAFCTIMCVAAEVTITKVQQRYPWNGLVDIEFEVPSATIINLYAVNLTTSTEIEMKTFLDSTGKTIEQPFQVSAGTHTITWNSDVDTPNTTKETIKFLFMNLNTPFGLMQMVVMAQCLTSHLCMVLSKHCHQTHLLANTMYSLVGLCVPMVMLYIQTVQ